LKRPDRAENSSGRACGPLLVSPAVRSGDVGAQKPLLLSFS